MWYVLLLTVHQYNTHMIPFSNMHYVILVQWLYGKILWLDSHTLICMHTRYYMCMCFSQIKIHAIQIRAKMEGFAKLAGIFTPAHVQPHLLVLDVKVCFLYPICSYMIRLKYILRNIMNIIIFTYISATRLLVVFLHLSFLCVSNVLHNRSISIECYHNISFLSVG